MRNIPIHIDFNGKHLTGEADPIEGKNQQGIPLSHFIYLDGQYIGTLSCEKDGWTMDKPTDANLVESLGEFIHAWYE